MENTHWLLWLTGAAGGGALIKVIADWMARLLKGKTEKGIDIVDLTSQITQVFEHTLKVTTESASRDRMMLEGRLYKLEAKVEEVSIELDTYREITSSAYDCTLLKGNPDYQCPVIDKKLRYNSNKCNLIQSLKDGEPIK